MTEFLVVHQVEDAAGGQGQLDVAGQSGVLGLSPPVGPAPVEARAGAAPIHRVLRPAGQPARQLAQFHLAQRSVLLAYNR